ncbi:MAG: hypothetical protein ACO39X_04065 [Candidatus Nanopelagicaceae bacterium]|jgi:N-acetyl-anhydromuramyl-L-alanine amidase AmpD
MSIYVLQVQAPKEDLTIHSAYTSRDKAIDAGEAWLKSVLAMYGYDVEEGEDAMDTVDRHMMDDLYYDVTEISEVL